MKKDSQTTNTNIVHQQDNNQNEANIKEKTLSVSKSDSVQSSHTAQLISENKSPVIQEKRRWDESFTVAEKKELEGNIVKAAKDNDGETYVTLQQEEFILVNDEDKSQEDDESQYSDESGTRKPGRRPLPDKDLSDCDQDPKVKRKVQNRAAQRAFRERKERYVKELEIKLKQVQENHLVAITQLIQENHRLRSFIFKLEVENHALKGIPYPLNYTASPPPPRESLNNSPYPSIAPLLPALFAPSPLLLSGDTDFNSTIDNIMLHASTPTPPSSTKSQQDKPKKKNPIKPKLSTQPLEYTFAISTPASLRPTTRNVNKEDEEAMKPVPLYSPDNLPINSLKNSCSVTSKSSQGSITDDEGDNKSDGQKHMQQLSLGMLSCHIDVEGQRFCERLYSEVCHEALDRLLNEPLFDSMGKLNLSVDPVALIEKEEPREKKLLTASEIWYILNRHPRFKEFSTDKLYELVKNLTKYSDDGPIMEESDMKYILLKMEKGNL
ncbi:hypothetical protein G6F43_002972 [Rhizopus delemar]|nr:hypothetical protein G6F43_002972 [Rhizopus delemar]